MDDFSYFLREGGTLDPQVDSRFFLHTGPKRKWPRSSSFRQWHGYCWFADEIAPRAVFPSSSAGPWSLKDSSAVWYRPRSSSTSAVACSRLVLLVTMIICCVPVVWRQAVMPGETFISVFSAMPAATVDTCLASVLVVDVPVAVHVGTRGEVVDIPAGVQLPRFVGTKLRSSRSCSSSMDVMS